MDRLYDMCGYIAAGFMVGIAVTIIAQIVSRLWRVTLDSTEAAGFCLAAATFFGLAHTFRRGGHVRINLLIATLSAKARHRVEVFNCLFGTIIMCFLGWHVSLMAIQSWRFNDISPGLLAMPFWIPQLGAAAGIIVFAIALIDELIWLLSGRPHRYEAPDEVDLDNPAA